MARGWENKAVESMMDDHDNRSLQRQRNRTPEQIEYEKKRASLDLTRRSLVNELANATHPRRQEQLRAALAHIEGAIGALGEPPPSSE